MRRPVSILLLAAPLASAAACTDSVGEPSSHTVTDSAGVTIVHSRRPAWSEGEGWQVEPEPRLEIGEHSGDQDYLLDRVMGTSVLDDGGVAVAHMGDNTIRFYDADGGFVHAVGGRGEGPGEFSQVMGIRRLGDELWADDARRAFNVYDLEGERLRTVTLPLEPPPGLGMATARGMFEDGTLVLGDWPQSSPKRPTAVVDSATLMSYANGVYDSLAVLPAVRLLPVDDYPFSTYQEFGPRMAAVVGREQLYTGFSETFELAIRDHTGRIHRIIRADVERHPVTDAHIARYQEDYLGMGGERGGQISPRLHEQRRALLNAQVYPEHHPAWGRIMEDRTGHLWIERPDPDHPGVRSGWHLIRDVPSAWEVFDPDGVWLGAVELPPRFVVQEIGADYVAGVALDALEVETVRVYDLNRGTAG